MIASTLGMIIDEPTASRTRARISIIADCEKAAQTDAAPKIESPVSICRR